MQMQTRTRLVQFLLLCKEQPSWSGWSHHRPLQLDTDESRLKVQQVLYLFLALAESHHSRWLCCHCEQTGLPLESWRLFLSYRVSFISVAATCTDRRRQFVSPAQVHGWKRHERVAQSPPPPHLSRSCSVLTSAGVCRRPCSSVNSI